VSRLGAATLMGLIACSGLRIVAAHDFWLQPNEYRTGPNDLITLTLEVGHGPFRQRSPIPARRIKRFQAIAPSGAVLDLQDHLRLGLPAEDSDFQLEHPGAHILVLQTDDQAQTHLPAIRFNDYLQAEGLTPALDERARLHRMDTDGSERYSRCAKSILQVGAPAADQHDRINEPVGLPLEIVPEASPYSVPRSSRLPIHVIYAGHPLAGALVKLTDLSQDATPFEVHVTDNNGHATFAMPSSGKWLLNVVWTKALPRTEETDFETVFSSLSFGF
jgi:uncharacterized GH25 family protein